MKKGQLISVLLGLTIAAAAAAVQRSHQPPSAGSAPVTTHVVAAANAFLATLTEPQRASGGRDAGRLVGP
jgi:hypothetical protein